MISKKDLARVFAKQQYHPTFEEVTARLWEAHDRHLARIEETRKELREQQYLRGGGDDIDIECKFTPSIISRGKDDEYRTLDQFIEDQY